VTTEDDTQVTSTSTQTSVTSRVPLSAAIAVGVVFLAVAANFLVSAITGVDYTEIADSINNLVTGVMASTGTTALILVVAVTLLGWWVPVWWQRPRMGPRWAILVPLGMLVSLSLGWISTLGSQRTAGYLAVLIATAMLVGFAEELAFRGVLVAGLRVRFSEGWVWFLSSLLFGLAHAGNAFHGQDIGTTSYQVFFTFMLGSVLYVARMVTGSLLVPIVLHGLWDVAALGQASADVSNASISQVGNLVQWVTIILGFVAIWKITKEARARRRVPVDVKEH
jgi:uncharacterized protein